jgi:hypothetical protein
MNKNMSMLLVALAFVATATLAPLAQAQEATSTATTTVATTTATTTPATNSTIAGLLAQLSKLTALFNELKAKLMNTEAEIKELRADIKEGMTSDDIKTIQELLASDPTIYPRGLVTGYFGPMTKEAIMKFQAKNGLEVTGLIDTETRAAMDAIIEQRRAEGKFPVGLLFAPGLKDKFEHKLKMRCDSVASSTMPGVACEKIKTKYKFEMDEKGRIKMESKMEKKMSDDMDDDDEDMDDDKDNKNMKDDKKDNNDDDDDDDKDEDDN